MHHFIRPLDEGVSLPVFELLVGCDAREEPHQHLDATSQLIKIRVNCCQFGDDKQKVLDFFRRKSAVRECSFHLPVELGERNNVAILVVLGKPTTQALGLGRVDSPVGRNASKEPF